MNLSETISLFSSSKSSMMERKVGYKVTVRVVKKKWNSVGSKKSTIDEQMSE